MIQIMGMWSANEIITHHDTLRREVVYNSCVTVHLSDITDTVSVGTLLLPKIHIQYKLKPIKYCGYTFVLNSFNCFVFFFSFRCNCTTVPNQ